MAALPFRLSASPVGVRGTTIEDFKVVYGAVGNGVTSDAQKFVDVKTSIVATPRRASILLPPGDYYCGTGNTAQFWAVDIPDYRLVGAGPDLTSITYGGPSPLQFGGRGQTQNTSNISKTATVVAGATQVTLLTPSEASRYIVGRFALMCGFDLQSIWGVTFGYPSNLHFLDWVKIKSADTVTGIVEFDRPLTNTYKSTWPEYDAASGGPAALMVLPASFDTGVQVMDMTIAQGSNQTYAQGRDITYRNIVFTGGFGGIPTQNILWKSIGCDHSENTIEVDKLIKEYQFDGDIVKILDCQSSSNDVLRMRNTTVTGNMTGTPKRTYIVGGEIASDRVGNGGNNTFSVGAAAYGRSDLVSIDGTIVHAISASGRPESGPGGIGFNNTHSMSGGVIAVRKGANVLGTANNGTGKVRIEIADTTGFFTGQTVDIGGVGGTTEVNGSNRTITVIDGTHLDTTINFVHAWTSGGRVSNFAPRWAVPGTNLRWSGRRECQGIFQVVDVTEDANFAYVETTEAGGFPNIELPGSGILNIGVHPCPVWNCLNATGCVEIVDLSQVGAQGRPLWESSKRTYVGSSADATGDRILLTTTAGAKPRLWGALNFIKINVVTPYAGALTLTFKLSQNDNYPVQDSTATLKSLGVTVNAKIAGERVITLAGNTGAQTGDTLPDLTVYSSLWLTGLPDSGPSFSRNVSAETNGPVITAEIDCDQGVVPSG